MLSEREIGGSKDVAQPVVETRPGMCEALGLPPGASSHHLKKPSQEPKLPRSLPKYKEWDIVALAVT